MEKKIFNLISAVTPDVNQVNEILRRLLYCGSINARLNAAISCLELNINCEKAELILDEIAGNNDVEMLSQMAKMAQNREIKIHGS